MQFRERGIHSHLQYGPPARMGFAGQPMGFGGGDEESSEVFGCGDHHMDRTQAEDYLKAVVPTWFLHQNPRCAGVSKTK